MTNEIFNIMTNGSKFSYESLQELNAINAKTFSKLAELQMSFARLGIDNSVEQAKLFTGTNNYEDLLSAESDLASTCSDRVLALTHEATDIVSESREELLSWMEKCFEEGKQEMTAVAETPTKPKPAAKKSKAKASQGKAA